MVKAGVIFLKNNTRSAVGKGYIAIDTVDDSALEMEPAIVFNPSVNYFSKIEHFTFF